MLGACDTRYPLSWLYGRRREKQPMSPTTAEKLEIDPLPHPDGASGGLNAIIDAVEEHINRSILLLASGDPGSAPDFNEWLDKKGLPGEEDLEKPDNESVMVEKYNNKQQDVVALTTDLDQKNKNIDSSKLDALTTSNTTYKNILEIVEQLRGTLGDDYSKFQSPDGAWHLTPVAEVGLLQALLESANKVHWEVETAANDADRQAREIDGSLPNVPHQYRTNGLSSGAVPSAGNAYRPPSVSDASYRVTDPDDPVGKALAVANAEVGTREVDAAFANKPYNNNSAWCAAFTSWVWKEAGYDVSWTDYDYVPSVWNDAGAMGLQRPNTSEAQPGDLIVFDWEGDGTPDHIGIVESVNGGTIHTIEGNSSDRVQRLKYGMNSGDIVGVIKPPPTGSDVRS